MTSGDGGRFAALRYRDFRLLWLGRLLSVAGSQMQLVAVNWHVYSLLQGQDLTPTLLGRDITVGADALALGGLGLARIVPVLIFAMIGGLAADTWDRRRVMMATTTASLMASLGLAFVTLTGNATVPLLYALTAAGAAAYAFDEPARQAIVPNLVARRDVSNAVSLNITLWYTASVAGPGVAGLLIAGPGLGAVYVIDAISFVAVLVALLLMRYRGGSARGRASGASVAPATPSGRGDGRPAMEDRPSEGGQSGRRGSARGPTDEAAGRTVRSRRGDDTRSLDDRVGRALDAAHEDATTGPWRAMLDGIRFTMGSRLIWSTMLLDFMATFFGSARTMLPLVAGDILGMGSVGYGLLATAQPVGAIVAGIALAMRPAPRRQGAVLLASVGLYGLATALFGLSTLFPLSYGLFALTGAGDTVSTVIRGTIRQLATPDELRGRMTGFNMMFFMGGPQLGELEAGVVAAVLGAPFAISSGGVAVVVLTALIAWRYPRLRRYDQADDAIA